ncbi:hypothetical protein MMPV_001032 [Pyropia vietnamensis]
MARARVVVVAIVVGVAVAADAVGSAAAVTPAAATLPGTTLPPSNADGSLWAPIWGTNRLSLPAKPLKAAASRSDVDGGSRQASSSNSDRQDDLRQRIAEVLAAPLAASGAGATYAIAKGGVPLVSDALGVANIELGVPMDLTSRTDVGSVSKQFTAFLLYMLDSHGRLSLDDDVRKYIPELPTYTAGTVTLRHMLHHVSGLPEGYTPFFLAQGGLDDSIPRPTLLDTIYRLSDLRFPPGTAWQYSNTNFILAGLVAERVTGKSLRELLAVTIFRPLGMTSSDLYDSTERVYPRLASSYAINVSAGVVPGGALNVALARESHRLTPVGSSGIITTPEDLLRWLANYGNNTLGGGQPLIEAMTAPYELRNEAGDLVPPTYAFGSAYGAGLFVTDLPVAAANTTVRVIHHSGIIAGYRSVVAWVPAVEMSLALQTTSAVFSDTFDLAAAIAAVALPGVFGGASTEGPGEEVVASPPPPPPPALAATAVLHDGTTSGSASPPPPEVVSVPAAAFAAATGVWSMDADAGPFGSFEVQVGGSATSSGSYDSSPQAYGYDGGSEPGGVAEWLFLDLGHLTRSRLRPVSATRFVGDFNGIPGVLTLEVIPPANSSAPTTATVTVAGPGEPLILRATRHPSLQLTTAALDAVAGTYTSERLGATYTFTPRGGGLGVSIDGDEGRLGSTFLPCCVSPETGAWEGGLFSNGRPGLPATVALGERFLLLTAAFGEDRMTMGVRIENGGQEDLDGVPFRRVGKCPV